MLPYCPLACLVKKIKMLMVKITEIKQQQYQSM